MEQISLEVKYQNDSPLNLNGLAESFIGISSEYDIFCRESSNISKQERQILVKEVKQGSIIVELFSLAGTTIPLLSEDINSILSFGNHVINGLGFFSNKNSTPPRKKYSTKNCNNFKKIIRPIIIGNNNSMTFNINETNALGNIKTLNKEEFSSSDANVIQSEVSKYQNDLKEKENNLHEKKAFYWSAASFSNINSSNDKGVIEEISNSPIKTIFVNNSDKKIMTEYNEKFKKEWQDLVYIVDVEVISVQKKIQYYRIINIYPEYTTSF